MNCKTVSSPLSTIPITVRSVEDYYLVEAEDRRYTIAFEKPTLRKPHRKAVALAGIETFNLYYPLRHTCLTRRAAHMVPYTQIP